MVTWLRLLANLRAICTEMENRFAAFDHRLETTVDTLDNHAVAQRLVLDNFATQLLAAAKEEHLKLERRVRELEGMLRAKKIDRRKQAANRRQPRRNTRRAEDFV